MKHSSIPFLKSIISFYCLCFAWGCGSSPTSKKTKTTVSKKTKSSHSPKMILKKTEQLQSSGSLVKVGQNMPFFSGWAITQSSEKPFNFAKYLKQKKKGVRQIVISVCASWCAPCKEGLKRLKKARKKFRKKKVDLLVLVADKKENAYALREKYGFKEATFIVDPFETYALKFSPGQSQRQLVLPKTFVLRSDGTVKRILGKEGKDWIRLLLK